MYDYLVLYRYELKLSASKVDAKEAKWIVNVKKDPIKWHKKICLMTKYV